MKLRKSREVLTGIFAELMNYTQRHFGDEEKMMRRYDFDGLQEQEAQYTHFAEKMAEMQQQMETGNVMVTMDLMDFLKAWLIKHIKGTDKQYQAFFKAKGVA